MEYGAFALSLLAGIVNAVGLLGFQHEAVSHLSGTATLFGTQVFKSSGQALHLLAVMASFVLGAVLSGLLIPDGSLKLGRHYETLLCVEGILLVAALLSLEQGLLFGHCLASAACGLQNALVTTYSGAVVRTTHVTGVFTDLGLMLGSMLRGRGFDRRRALLFLLIITGFIAGGVAGAWLFVRLAFWTLAVPAAMCFLLALVYRRYRLRVNRP